MTVAGSCYVQLCRILQILSCSCILINIIIFIKRVIKFLSFRFVLSDYSYISFKCHVIILDTLNRRAFYLILLMKHSKIIIKKLIYNAQYV